MRKMVVALLCVLVMSAVVRAYAILGTYQPGGDACSAHSDMQTDAQSIVIEDLNINGYYEEESADSYEMTLYCDWDGAYFPDDAECTYYMDDWQQAQDQINLAIDAQQIEYSDMSSHGCSCANC